MESLAPRGAPAVLTSSAALSDAEIVQRVRAGDRALFEILMRRHNQRVYRAARAIVDDEAEVEDIMQQAYLNAFAHLHQFEERSQFSTWLIRIAINEAFARQRLRRKALARQGRSRERVQSTSAVDIVNGGQGEMDKVRAPQPDPEHQAYASELHRVLEEAVDALPENYRLVFMLRDVEGLSTSETGEGLGLAEEAVKTRLHRARAMLRRAVTERIGAVASETFQFHAPRCDRVVAAVFAMIG